MQWRQSVGIREAVNDLRQSANDARALATKCWDQRGCKRCKSHWRQSVGIREAVNDARAIGDKVLGSERL